jgi:seryl-tRNA synthetase
MFSSNFACCLQYGSIDKSFNNKFGEFIIDFVYDVTLTVISRALIKQYLFFQKKNTYNKQKSTKKRQKSTKKKTCQHNKINKTPFFIEHYYLFPKTEQSLYNYVRNTLKREFICKTITQTKSFLVVQLLTYLYK